MIAAHEKTSFKASTDLRQRTRTGRNQTITNKTHIEHSLLSRAQTYRAAICAKKLITYYFRRLK